MSYGRMLAILGVVLMLGGCTLRPILNVSDAPVVVSAGKRATPDQVRNAIGNALGWQMTPAGPGLVNGRSALRDHGANVEIRYTATAFSIVYKDSTNLNYKDGQIHRNYNGWIENLDRGIRNELNRI